MAQRTTFTKEKIVEAAYDLTQEQGWGAVTSRAIASKLGSSTMPLYSSLRSMDEIETHVRARAESALQEYQRRKYTENSMLNSAVGYVTFARDQRQLFRFLFVDRPLAANRPRRRAAVPDIYAAGGVADLADQAAIAMGDPRVLKSWAFAHGLASLLSAGVLELTDNDIARLLSEVGAAIYSPPGGSDG
jgi:AcrR family transcriptional regulator